MSDYSYMEGRFVGMGSHRVTETLCPATGRESQPFPMAMPPVCICHLLSMARADERERMKALGRMLLDSGDITPMGVRLITQSRDD